MTKGKMILSMFAIVAFVVVLGYIVFNQDVKPRVEMKVGQGTQTQEARTAIIDPSIGTMRSAGYIDVTPQEALTLMMDTPDLVVVDVSPNFDNGHLPGALNYYLGDGTLDEALLTLDKSRPYLVYCHVDSVAIAGAERFVDNGFTEVYRLQGNYPGWVEAGLPTELPERL